MSGLELLAKRIKAGTVQLILLAVIMVFMGLGLLATAAWQVFQGELGSAGFIALMGGGALLAALMMVAGARAQLRPRSSDIYVAFASEPHRIAWAHEVAGKTNGVRVHLLNGDEHTLTGNAAQIRELLQLVRDVAPHAILGFGTAEQEEYKRRVKAARASKPPASPG